MSLYHVTRREFWYSTTQVEASSPEEAIQIVRDGDGNEIVCEFSDVDDTSYAAELKP